tara:strand:+ start:86 stop:313 length:228 start_codon:yes stop_codon:yes gene_type:complete
VQKVTNEERNLAIKALEQIARHEAECGERWGEALNELKNLRSVADAHAARWERLAWLVVGTVVTTSAGVCAAMLA